jgi:hypothetical protein
LLNAHRACGQESVAQRVLDQIRRKRREDFVGRRQQQRPVGDDRGRPITDVETVEGRARDPRCGYVQA